MVIITLKDTDEVLASGKKVEVLSNGYCFLGENNTAYPPDLICVYEIPEIPDDVQSDSRYCYTKEKGFYENPFWRSPLGQRNLTDLMNCVTDLQLALCEVYEMLPAEEV